MGVAKEGDLSSRLLGRQAKAKQAQLHPVEMSMGHVDYHMVQGDGSDLVLPRFPAIAVTVPRHLIQWDVWKQLPQLFAIGPQVTQMDHCLGLLPGYYGLHGFYTAVGIR
jgi:hypothetical protein